METDKNEPKAGSSVGDRMGTLGANVILGFLGYALLFGILFFGLAASGESAWYAIYIPLLAIPGVLLGPLVLAWRKRSGV